MSRFLINYIVQVVPFYFKRVLTLTSLFNLRITLYCDPSLSASLYLDYRRVSSLSDVCGAGALCMLPTELSQHFEHFTYCELLVCSPVCFNSVSCYFKYSLQ